ncbi:perosamine synthetase [Candidatus Nanopelagicus limnes]|uniref:Perosamine synthetase n=1 Tax=Candidatus Nanopelagicus limnae TaxID=1884634 RepID=A0A249JZH1_9ACTN|nr:aminotransferase class I/II-fold pyridoxal phosphate-dependent enzyme [Candidatus Nanopelagicus limnes]ASY09909.1 perosamine synthetase [Candidatus Nanopelagicus limnes]
MIPYGKQSISEEDIASVSKALRENFLTTGPLVEFFENEISKVVGAPAISVSSGTAALHCAYAAIGIEPGDEVITPPLTFIATQATAALMGAKIVFADIQEDTGNIDPKAVEAAITTRTKAIVAVDYAGHPADMDELRLIADRHSIYLIEDASHSLGSTYKGRPVGSLADLTTFSFFPTKNITTGEGGAVSSPKPELLAKAKSFSRQGLVRDPNSFILNEEGPWHQEVHEFGLNYRLPDILCALGISQLSRIIHFKRIRMDTFNYYGSLLSHIDNVRIPIIKSSTEPMWHLYPIRVNADSRKRVFEGLRTSGVGVQVNYLPAHLHPVFTKYSHIVGQFPVSELFYSQQISLPMHVGVSKKEIDYISETLLKLISYE